MRSRRSGERESGTARLEEAVAAYRAALEERTRDRVPLDWAMTQNNLGNALCDAGRAGERDGASGGGGRGVEGVLKSSRRQGHPSGYRICAHALILSWRKSGR